MNYGGLAEINGVVGVCVMTNDRLMFYASKKLKYKSGDVIRMGDHQVVVAFDTDGMLTYGTTLLPGDVIVIEGPVYSIVKHTIKD
jgi:signal peptidase I